MQKTPNYRWRYYFIIAIFLLVVLGLLSRLTYLSIFDRSFLLHQSDSRVLRIVNTPAYRGMITDRYGTPLAISTPMDSVWVNPAVFKASWTQLSKLSKLLNMHISEIKQHVHQEDSREFVYLKRELPPDIAAQIKALSISGLFFQPEYRRYYPDGEVIAHVIGFTNIDDDGAEGLELSYDKWLRGIPGKERVVKDRLGNTIGIVDVLSQPVQGQDLTLSLDDRIQYLAYKNLQDSVQKYHADAGSVVVLNPKTGEILAMANYPVFNPNERPLTPNSNFRNRAVTDVFEPGSTIKTFSVVDALESGQYTPATKVDTNPGWVIINGDRITDDVPNNGILTLSQVLQKSSNIGISKVILSLPLNHFLNLLQQVGFGKSTQSGFPGEVNGILPMRDKWSPIDIATLSFGYGISVTALQLAHAYSIIANNGVDIPVTFLKQDKPVTGQQVIDTQTAQQTLAMLERVVQTGATAAAIPGYRVGGKTGTSYTAIAGGYDKTRYNSSFIGIAPVSNPQLVTVVVLHNVSGDVHFGAQVAAPIFANITGDALRILAIPPDNLPIVGQK